MLHRTPAILPFLYPGLLWRMATDKKELYLTFDDGPVPGPTEFVLKTLNDFQIKATFFCIGDNVRKHSTIFKQIVVGGHTIGNHTYNHLKGWQTSTDLYLENTEKCNQEILKHHTSFNGNLFRPPYGRITRTQIKRLSSKKIVMWDVLTRDYDTDLKPENCLKKSLSASRNGSIIVFHDSLKAERNMQYVLPRFIEESLNQGFTFKELV